MTNIKMRSKYRALALLLTLVMVLTLLPTMALAATGDFSNPETGCLTVPASAIDSISFTNKVDFGESKGSYDNDTLYVVTVPNSVNTVKFGSGRGYAPYSLHHAA